MERTGMQKATWHSSIVQYTGRKFTFPIDKLQAIAAVATRYADQRVSDLYLAGLWRNTLLHDLLWLVKHPEQNQRVKSGTVPTWSWASVTGGVAYADMNSVLIRPVNASHVVDVSYRVEGPHMTGKIRETAITLQAPVLHSALAAYHADVDGPQLKAVDSDIHPTFCRIRWDFQETEWNELPAEVFILPLCEEPIKYWPRLLSLVLHASQEKGVYIRAGLCTMSWNYSKESLYGKRRKARKVMLKFLESFPIQGVVLI
jgi:hypothetical protein